MRYIDTTALFNKANNWGKHNATELWRDKTLRQDFKEYFYSKCWYTEIKLLGQDIHIDHFRPKAKIEAFGSYNYNTQLAPTGYDWLKNDYKNYRACCIYANRKTGPGGKGNYFPLKTGSNLAIQGNINGEIGMLIDPCVKQDVELISFFCNKIVCSSQIQYDQERVEISSIIYNLNDSIIANERLRIWNNVDRCIDNYKKDKISKEVLVEELEYAIDRGMQLSAVAIACIKNNIENIPKDVYNKLNLSL